MWGSLIVHYWVIMSVGSNGPSMWSVHPCFLRSKVFHWTCKNNFSRTIHPFLHICLHDEIFWDASYREWVIHSNQKWLITSIDAAWENKLQRNTSACTPQIINPKVWRRDDPGWKMTSPLTTPITGVRIKFSFTHRVKFKE